MRRRGTTNLDDIRRAMRLGMGPCQGGFCIYRATGILHAVDRLDGEEAADVAAPLPAGALEGRLPDPLRRPAAPGAARRLDLPGPARRRAPARATRGSRRSSDVSHHDAIVVGCGLAGLTAGVRLAEAGARVLVLAKGVGATHLAPGTIDVLGYHDGERVEKPLEALGALGPGAPVRAGRRRRRGRRGGVVHRARGGRLARALRVHGLGGAQRAAADGGRRREALRGRAGDDGRGRPRARATRSWPSASAASRTSTRRCSPTCSRARACARAAIELELVPEGRADVNALGYARAFDDPAFRGQVVGQLAAASSAATSASRSPPCSASPTRTASGRGWSARSAGASSRCRRCRRPCPACASSRCCARRCGARAATLRLNNVVVGAERDGDRVTALRVRVGLREERHAADWIVLASGGFASGGIELDSHWAARDVALGLDVAGVPAAGEPRFTPGYFDEQPMSRAGIAVDDELRPLGADGGARASRTCSWRARPSRARPRGRRSRATASPWRRATAPPS